MRLSALQHTLQPVLGPARLIVFAADHGMTAAGQAAEVSAYPRALTASMFRAVASGQAACAALCTANGATLELVDVGVDADVSGVAPGSSSITVVHAKVRRGSHSMLAGPALAAAELDAALQAGAAAVARFASCSEAAPSTCVLCVGELGIGNTTAAAAVLAVLTGLSPQEVCGRGTGMCAATVVLLAAIFCRCRW